MPPSSPPDTLSLAEFEALEGMARTLTASGLYRVIRRFSPRLRYTEDDGSAKATALFVDVETTGLDLEHDAIIEFAAVPFQYCKEDGRIFDVGEAVSFLEDPGRPIPEHVTALTGITSEMVCGQRIDDDRVASLLEPASLVIAHNARFDRRMIERRLPHFERKPWACSQAEVPWREHGCRSAALDFILVMACGEFFTGHRATEDCYAGIHVLATRTCNGALPLRMLLESARRCSVRIWADRSPIERNHLLRSRGYHFDPGRDGGPKSWYVDVPESEAEAECAWLEAEIFGRKVAGLRRQRITATTRYSARI